ncbi:hypothetical protein [Pseudomonas fluorescens]|uniref:hypothetical protein n=1 Tax=Pseudomonas fluorescens TaxID=294 RepID=UPI001242B0C7|nr:hypothetical protein [Pseudomonas fluorescens]VVM74200.1 hypothetical protein PS676_01934 [Pseudomonas fluorescens]
MISNHSTIVEAHRPVSDALSAKVAQFLAAGGQITQGESPAINPLPPTRSENIDPETVLKRRRPSPTRAERIALRRITEAL